MAHASAIETAVQEAPGLPRSVASLQAQLGETEAIVDSLIERLTDYVSPPEPSKGPPSDSPGMGVSGDCPMAARVIDQALRVREINRRVTGLLANLDL